MSYNYRIINDHPTHFYPLGVGPSAFHDFSVRSNGQVNGSPEVSPPLVVGGGNGYVFTGNNNFRFFTRVFQEDSVRLPFTLEAWFKPVSLTSDKGIVGHAGMHDGLCFDGERICFTTYHGPAGVARAEYFPPSTTGSFHVVGVHTGSKNELYVNGVRVASVDLTEEQLLYGYQIDLAPGYLYVGHLSGSIIIDAVAVYSYALNSRQAKLHFLWGRDVPDLRNVALSRGGTYWDFTDETADIVLDLDFATEQDWYSGESFSMRIVDDNLLPLFEDDVSIAGSWKTGLILSAVEDQLDGSKITWDSDGSVTVQSSLDDGQTWTDAINGQEVPGISQNFFSAGKSLQLRILFPGGLQADTITKVRSLSVILYRGRRGYGSTTDQRPEYTGSFSLSSVTRQPIEHDDKTGARLYSASVSIPAVKARTLELWISPHSSPSSNNYIFRTGSPGEYLRYATSQWATSGVSDLYVNGVRRSGASISIPANRWTHIVAVLNSQFTGNVTIGGSNYPMNLGFYVNYEDALTETQAIGLYNAYLGIPQLSATDQTGLSISDSSTDTVKIYTHSWTLSGSG